jgi:hypothetical protein
LADKFNTSIIIVHHCRKQSSNDPLDTINGTLGITGAADGVMVLDRGSLNTDATLLVAGRDVRRASYAMAFEQENLSWKILGDADEFQNTKMQQEIFDAIKSSDEPLRPKQITELTGLKNPYVRKTLFKMVEKGAIQKFDHGRYTLPKSEKA